MYFYSKIISNAFSLEKKSPMNFYSKWISDTLLYKIILSTFL